MSLGSHQRFLTMKGFILVYWTSFHQQSTAHTMSDREGAGSEDTPEKYMISSNWTRQPTSCEGTCRENSRATRIANSEASRSLRFSLNIVSVLSIRVFSCSPFTSFSLAERMRLAPAQNFRFSLLITLRRTSFSKYTYA